jgi:hypothetical protein
MAPKRVGRLQSEVWRELEREEGVILRGIALELVAAKKRNDWQAVAEVAKQLAEVAMVKDPPEGDDDAG